MSATSTRTTRHIRNLLAFFVVLLTASTGSRVWSQGPTIGNYQLVSEQPLKGSSVLLTYRATLTNAGPALAGATAIAMSRSGSVKIIDGTLTFGPVEPSGTVVSSDTFSFSRGKNSKFDWSTIAWTITPIANQPPVANAGSDFTQPVNQTAQLSGSASSDPEGASLTFGWSFVSRPAGSATVLINPTAVNPAFLVDRPGAYVVQLVVNDGVSNSAPDTVTITTPNSAPVANAGPDQTLVVGSMATLDGTGSSDIDGNQLTYTWSVLSLPPGSNATLSDPAAVGPTFLIDRPGQYQLQLVVNDGAINSSPDVVVVSTINSAPVANAGPDQTHVVGATATLHGSGSSDVDGDQLTYAWSFQSKPIASIAVLSDPAAVSPTFQIDVPGEYRLQLVVNDGLVNSASDTVVITTQNSPPVANAGPDQTLNTSDTVPLNGGGSTDVDGDVITYAWSLITVPSGSTATLSDPSAVMPTFVADRPGTYVAQLIVHDGTVASEPDTSTITTLNSAPVADAGPDQTVVAGQVVSLDGTQSSDSNGDSLTFRWSFATVPNGSTAVLINPNHPRPTFVSDRSGTYIAQLIVNDGFVDSAPDTVTIATTNSLPTANAGPDQAGVTLGEPVTLDGTQSSDPDGQPLTYSWALISRPATSAATLDDSTVAIPAFTPDLAGDYVVQLIVNDGFADSAPDTVLIRANSPPIANAGPDLQARVGSLAQLDGTQSSDPDGQPLTYAWTLVSRPTTSGAELDDPALATPAVTPDVAGDYVAQLIVNDGFSDSAPETVVIHATDPPLPVANAGADQQVPIGGPAVQLDGSGSIDPDGGTLSFSWAFTSVPAGSIATIQNATTASPVFIPDVIGDYSVDLTVVTAAGASTDSVVITVTPPLNHAPVANAGPDQTLVVGSTAALDGSGSSDIDGNLLTYTWNFLSQPSGSTATLSDPSAVGPTFVIDRPGQYQLQLVVNDGSISSSPDVVVVSTINSAPVANAGADQTVNASDTVSLNGGGSTDIDGDLITYAWSLITVPLGSAATLNDPSAVMPTFVADLTGTYVAQLIVHDGTVASAPDTSTISTLNSAPVADAGPDQTVVAGQVVLLDGTPSSDANGDLLTFRWSFATVPSGSTAVLVNPNDPRPTFVSDREGTYIVQLIVNDGFADSAPDTVTIATTNSLPTASAGPDQVGVTRGTLVTLDGSQSSDPDGQPLTYSWALISRPASSAATFDDSTVAMPAFTPDLAGDYVVQLIVHDGFADSAPDTVLIRANSLPIANAGPDQQARIGRLVQLDGTQSTDTDGQPLAHAWTLISRPATSGATLDAPTLATPSITPDVAGDYVAQLIVNDGFVDSAPDTVVIHATNPPLPVANAGADQQVPIGGPPVQLDGSGSSDPDGGALTFSWVFTSVPVGSTAALQNAATASPTFIPDVIGGYSVQLTVVTAAGASTDSVMITVTPPPNHSPVANDDAFSTDENAALIVTAPGLLGNDVDLDGDTLTASKVTDPAHGTVAISPTGGFEYQPAAGYNGPDTFTYQVSDGFQSSNVSTVSIDVRPFIHEFLETITVIDSVRKLPDITLALLNTPVVGVGLPAALQVTLEEPAPPGGVIVTVTSDDVSRLAVAAPGTTTIADGETVGAVMLNGLSSGSVTVRANAYEHVEGTLAVAIVQNIISVPTTMNVPLGQVTSLPITITRDPGNTSAVSIDVVSNNPGAVTVTTPNVTVPAGQLSVNATVFGQGTGTATMTATAANFVPDSGSVTTTASLDITVSTLAINSGFGGSITIELESPVGSLIAAPAGGVLVSLSADDPACVLIPGTVLIAPGTASATADVSYSGPAALPCTTIVTASSIAGIAPDGVTITVSPAPSITLAASLGSVGGGLQIGAFTATLGESQHGGVTVHLTSSDPSRVLLSTSSTIAGSAFIDFPLANGQTSFFYYVQALDWVSGSSSATVTVTASAPGFSDDTTTVTYVQPALQLASMPTTTTALSTNTDFNVQVGVPSAGNASVASPQARRAGAPDLTVTVTNSNATVAEIDLNGGVSGAQSQTAAISAGSQNTPSSGAGSLEFDPLAGGSTIVTATIPDFITTTAGVRTVTVTAVPAITLAASLGSIGGGLQVGPFGGSLGASQHGGVTVHLTSSDPTRVLLSTTSTIAGTAFIDIPVANGQTGFSFFVQALDWVSGSSSATVTVTASAPGFSDDTTTVTYVQPALQLASMPTTTTALSTNTDFNVQVGVPSAGNASVASPQARRAGAPDLTVTVTNSNATVAEIDLNGGVSGAQSQTAAISAGSQNTPSSGAGSLEFDPLAGGSTIVTATIPDFITTTAGVRTVTVTAVPAITLAASLGSIGGGLQVGPFGGSLGASQHGGVTVHLTSSDPTRVLLSTTSTIAGTAFIDIPVANGQTGFSFFVQALDWVAGSSSATVTVTASAPGFSDDTTTVTYVQPALTLVSAPTTTTALSTNTDFYVQVGVPSAGNAFVASPQARRVGAAALTVTVTNSNATVAEIDLNGGVSGAQSQTAAISAGSQTTPPSGAGGLEFDPLSTGTSTLTASIPDFITTTAGAKTVTVTVPAVTLAASLGSLAGGLQAGPFGGNLGASQHGGVTIRMTSSDPTRVLVAPDSTTPGSEFIDIPVANGSTSFTYFVQGLDWVPGSSSSATVTVTASAPGFTSDTTSVVYVQPALQLASVPTTTTAAAANADFSVQVGVPTAGNAGVSPVQARRAGAPDLTVTVTNSDAARAEIDLNGGLSGAQSQTAAIRAGVSGTPFNATGGLEFDPLSAGSTTVAASIPNFIVTTAATRSVTINP